MKKLTRLVSMLLAALLIHGVAPAALASGFYTYTSPPGFTADEQYDMETGRLSLRLLSGDSRVVLTYHTEYFVDFVGMNLLRMPPDQLPWLLAMTGIDTAMLGLTPNVVVVTSDASDAIDEQFAYVSLKDQVGMQDYILTIGSDGWIEFHGLTRYDAPLTEADYKAHYIFYESVQIGWPAGWGAEG